MGLIQTRKGMGGGSFVVEVDASITKLGLLNYFYFKNLFMKDISMIRQLIEPFATKLATQKMSDKDISILKDLNTFAKKHIKANDYKEVFQVGIPDLAIILEAHEKIYAAIKDRDQDRAAEEMLNHVNELEEILAEKEKNLSLKDVYSKATTYNYHR